jgi:hypothetical protein
MPRNIRLGIDKNACLKHSIIYMLVFTSKWSILRVSTLGITTNHANKIKVDVKWLLSPKRFCSGGPKKAKVVADSSIRA